MDISRFMALYKCSYYYYYYYYCITSWFQIPGKPHCISASSDGKFIFVGTSDSLVVVDALSQTTKDTWKDDSLEIVNINVADIEEDAYLLSVTSDLGEH